MFTQDEFFKLMTTKEDLCDELQAHYSNDKLPMVRHPLLYSVPYNEAENAMLNYRFKLLKEAVQKNLEDKDYAGYIFLHEKPYRFNAFKEVMEHLQDEIYWELLSDVWSNSENIWQNLKEWKKLLSSERKGKGAFMDKDERKIYNALPDTVIAYRGYLPGKNINGISYTISKEKAEWFANRWNKKGKVLTMRVPRKKVFAYLNGRNEQEIIIL